jgi:hypothetical protein
MRFMVDEFSMVLNATLVIRSLTARWMYHIPGDASAHRYRAENIRTAVKLILGSPAGGQAKRVRSNLQELPDS